MNPETLDTSSPLCKIEQLRQVHTIADRFAMANTYIIDTDPLIVVDPRSEMHVRLLCEYVESILKRSLTQIGMIVLTNLQADQLDGLAAMQRVVHAPVAAAATLLYLVQSQRDTLHAYGWSRPDHTILPPSFERQVRFVSDWLEDSMYISSCWQVIACSGYSPDSLCLYSPATAEFISGDTIIAIQKRVPVLRAGSDSHQLETMLRFLRTLHVHYVYPGYGRPMLALHPLSNMGVEW